MRIGFIGGGVMGEAMIRGILARGVARPEEIIVCDTSAIRREALSRDYGVKVTEDHSMAIKGAEVIVLAVKPQNLAEVMEEMRGRLKSGQLVLSIVAGKSIATLTRGLEYNDIVRAMPNTPAQIGEGMSVWTAQPEVTRSQREMAKSILSAIGREINVSNERYIDMATAVSGSGPAYVFLFIESLIDAAVHIGLPRDMAEGLVLQTMLGSSRLAQESGKAPAELRNMVTSPGGTTAEGLLQLEEGGMRAIIAHAVIAGYEKARELGG